MTDMYYPDPPPCRGGTELGPGFSIIYSYSKLRDGGRGPLPESVTPSLCAFRASSAHPRRDQLLHPHCRDAFPVPGSLFGGFCPYPYVMESLAIFRRISISHSSAGCPRVILTYNCLPRSTTLPAASISANLIPLSRFFYVAAFRNSSAVKPMDHRKNT